MRRSADFLKIGGFSGVSGRVGTKYRGGHTHHFFGFLGRRILDLRGGTPFRTSGGARQPLAAARSIRGLPLREGRGQGWGGSQGENGERRLSIDGHFSIFLH